MGQSFSSKETTRWQGLGLEPSTLRSEVQRATPHYTIVALVGRGGGVIVIEGPQNKNSSDFGAAQVDIFGTRMKKCFEKVCHYICLETNL